MRILVRCHGLADGKPAVPILRLKVASHMRYEWIKPGNSLDFYFPNNKGVPFARA